MLLMGQRINESFVTSEQASAKEEHMELKNRNIRLENLIKRKYIYNEGWMEHGTALQFIIIIIVIIIII